jgi:hypothetical protein
MAEENDWESLKEAFNKAYNETGIGVKAWCEENNIKYATARRYIKLDRKKKPLPKTKVVVKKETERGVIHHGGYSQYFNENITSLTSGATLEDELILCRSRIHMVIHTTKEIQRRLKDPDVNVEVAASLYESLFKADTALERNIARVESITRTLSSLRLDDLNEDKIAADTKRSVATTVRTKAQTTLTELQTEKARKELGGTSKLDEYIDNIVGDSVDKVVG